MQLAAVPHSAPAGPGDPPAEHHPSWTHGDIPFKEHVDVATARVREKLAGKFGLSGNAMRTTSVALAHGVVRRSFIAAGARDLLRSLSYVSDASDAFRHLWVGSSRPSHAIADIMSRFDTALDAMDVVGFDVGLVLTAPARSQASSVEDDVLEHAAFALVEEQPSWPLEVKAAEDEEARAAAPIEVEQPPPPLEAAQAYKMKRYRFKRLPCLHAWVGEIVVGPWRCSVCGKTVASGEQAVGVRCDLPGCAAMHCSACHRRLLALGLEP